MELTLAPAPLDDADAGPRVFPIVLNSGRYTVCTSTVGIISGSELSPNCPRFIIDKRVRLLGIFSF